MDTDTKNLSTQFRETKCLFCDHESDEQLYPATLSESSISAYAFSARRKRDIEHYRIVECQNCSLVRSNPVLREEVLENLYAESQYFFSDEAPFAANTYASLLQDLTEKFDLQLGSLLELGCSTGFFLEKALDMGITDVLGFEPSADCFRNASDRIKPSIIQDVFRTDVLNNQKFDIACSFHVFDHLTDPLKVLNDFNTVLNAPGYVLIVCHDVESWSIKILGDSSPVFDVEHIYLFSQKTIGRLLEAAGFEVLEIGSLKNTYPLGYWMRMLPFASKLLNLIPKRIGLLPIGLKAGNLFALGRKVSLNNDH